MIGIKTENLVLFTYAEENSKKKIENKAFIEEAKLQTFLSTFNS